MSSSSNNNTSTTSTTNPVRASIAVVGDAVVKTTEVAANVTESVMSTVLPPYYRNRDDENKRYKELCRLEKKRRAILKRVEEPFWKTLMYWDGTVLSHICRDSVLWITMGLYIAVRIAAREGLPDFVSDLDSGRMGIVGGFLTFFLVFYVNQSHKRFFQLYGHSMACKGRIFDAATLAKSCHMPQQQALKLVRYMNASHAAAYVGLSSVYPAFGYFDRVCFDQFKLLTKEEKQRMDTINMDAGGSAYRELIVWAMLEVQKAKDANLIDKELAAMLRDQVLQLRAQAGQLYNAADLPIPFFYVHFICLLTALYLPLFAIIQGINAGTGSDSHWSVDVVAGLVVFLQAIFIIGLRILGQKVSDPYGDDLVDLSVMFFVQFTWTQSNRVLMSVEPPTSQQSEEDLARERITIGPAWDQGTDHGLGQIKKHKSKRKHDDLNAGTNPVDNADDNDDPESTEDGDGDDDDSSSDGDDDGRVMNEQIGFGTYGVK